MRGLASFKLSASLKLSIEDCDCAIGMALFASNEEACRSASAELYVAAGLRDASRMDVRGGPEVMRSRRGKNESGDSRETVSLCRG